MAKDRGSAATSVGMMEPKRPSAREMMEDDVERLVERALGAMSSATRRAKAVKEIMAVLDDGGEK